MNVWLKTCVVLLAFLLNVPSRDITKILKEIFRLKRVNIKRWFLFSFIWRSFSNTNLFISTPPLFKYLPCVRYDHHRIFEIGKVLISVVKFYFNQNNTPKHFYSCIHFFNALLCFKVILSFEILILLWCHFWINESLGGRSLYKLVNNLINGLRNEKIERKSILFI